MQVGEATVEITSSYLGVIQICSTSVMYVVDVDHLTLCSSRSFAHQQL